MHDLVFLVKGPCLAFGENSVEARLSACKSGDNSLDSEMYLIGAAFFCLRFFCFVSMFDSFMKTLSDLKRYLCLGMSLCVICPADARAQTIEMAMQEALRNHPTVQAAEAFLEASKQDIHAERSGYFPEIAAGVAGGRIYGDNATTRGLSTTRGVGYSGYGEATASLTQPLFDGFATSNRLSAAKARERSANMELADARENLALRAAQSYIDIMRVHTALVMLKRQAHQVEDYVQRIKTSVDQGGLDEAAYQQALDVKATLDSFVADYEGQARVAEARYLEAVGHTPKGDMAVPAPDARYILLDVNRAIEAAKANHPALRSVQFSAMAAQHGIETEKASLFPEVNAELSALKSDKRELLGGEIEDGRALLRMNWSFETGGGQFSRIDRKHHEYAEAQARIKETQRQVESQIRQSYAELETANKQLKFLDERLELNKKLFSTYETQFDAARVSLLQLMQADNQVFNIKLDKLNAEYRVIAAEYGVLASLGKLQHSVDLALAQR